MVKKDLKDRKNRESKGVINYTREEVELVETSVDGELQSSNTVRSVGTGAIEKEPRYVKLYLDDIGKLNGLNNSEQKLVNELVFNMGYNNIVPSYKPVKEIIAAKLNMKYNTLEKCIKNLYKKGILIRKARGLYLMDPKIFGRGTWNNVQKIRMVIDYNSDGTKTINSDVSKQLGLFNET